MTSWSEDKSDVYDDQLRHIPIRKSGNLAKQKRPEHVRKRKAVRRGIKQRRVRRIQW